MRYIDDDAVSYIDLAIDIVMRLAKHVQGSIAGLSRQDIIVGYLSILAPSFKHSAFRDEAEWRLIFSKPHKPMPGRRFRAGKSTVVPFVEVELNKDSNGGTVDNYMIREVVVGPTPSADLSIAGLNILFESKGHAEVTIESSAIPYRHW